MDSNAANQTEDSDHKRASGQKQNRKEKTATMLLISKCANRSQYLPTGRYSLARNGSAGDANNEPNRSHCLRRPFDRFRSEDSFALLSVCHCCRL